MKHHVKSAVAVSGMTALLFSGAAMAAGGEHHDGHSTAHDTHHNQHFVGLFAGQRDAEGEKDTVIGIEYEYKINKQWGVGLIYEDAKDAHHGDGVDAILGMVYLHPWRGLRLGVGIGEESIGGHHPHDETLYRVGVGYEFHLSHHWAVGVAYNRDFVDSEHADVYGASIVYSF